MFKFWKCQLVKWEIIWNSKVWNKGVENGIPNMATMEKKSLHPCCVHTRRALSPSSRFLVFIPIVSFMFVICSFVNWSWWITLLLLPFMAVLDAFTITYKQRNAQLYMHLLYPVHGYNINASAGIITHLWCSINAIFK